MGYVGRGLVGAFIGVCVLTSVAGGAEVTMRKAKSKPMAALMLEGEITSGDADRIETVIREAAAEGRQVTTLYARSPGGDVLEALKISALLNKNLIDVNAPEPPITRRNAKTGEVKTIPDDCHWDKLSDTGNCVCYSSCGIIWLTAPFRSGGYIGIHRPRFLESYFAGLNSVEAQEKYQRLTKAVSSFLSENEVPNELITRMMAMPSGKMHILTEEEIAMMGEGKAYVLELLDAKCSAYQAEREKRNRLEQQYNDLQRDFDELVKNGSYDSASRIGDRLDAAQEAYYSYKGHNPTFSK